MELLGIAFWVGDGELVAFQQQEADEIGGNLLGLACKEGLGKDVMAMGVACVGLHPSC